MLTSLVLIWLNVLFDRTLLLNNLNNNSSSFRRLKLTEEIDTLFGQISQWPNFPMTGVPRFTRGISSSSVNV